MTTHDLKVWPEFFGPLERGEKLFELRLDDRDFQVGDWLKLREWAPANIETATPAQYTGARVMRRIAYVLEADVTKRLIHRTDPAAGTVLREGYVILGLAAPISELPCKLNDHRLFVEGVDPAVAREAGAYLIDLTAFVERVKTHAQVGRAAASKVLEQSRPSARTDPDELIFTFKTNEEDRQTLVLALASLARERPGWMEYLRAVSAEKFGSEVLFDNLCAALKPAEKTGSAT